MLMVLVLWGWAMVTGVRLVAAIEGIYETAVPGRWALERIVFGDVGGCMEVHNQARLSAFIAPLSDGLSP
jgi:hypothetical protein